MTNAIEVRGVSKKFRLYQEKYNSVKERVLHAGRTPHHDFWALQNIELDIVQGETLGIVGRNGCGKSTLLKCVAGILKPTKGEIRLRGQLAAMLELGAGFQPELSGRDNIFLNASLLGVSRRDVEKSFDEIVAFAELEEFIDNQVRFYSSGMYVRLGFAVAVSVEPDILLVDEVLAVGDERFQQKCMQRIHDFQREGRTIVVVSHSVDSMRHLCNRVAVMNAGELRAVGRPGEAIRAFHDILDETDASAPIPAVPSGPPTGARARKAEAAAAAGAAAAATAAAVAAESAPVTSGTDRLRIVSSRLDSATGRPHLQPGEAAAVVIDVEARESVSGVAFGCSVFAANGALLFEFDSGQETTLPQGRSTVAFRFASLPLLDGSYAVNVRVQGPGGGTVYARREPAATIVVENPGTSSGIVALPLGVEVMPGGSDSSAPTVLVEHAAT